MGRTEGKNVILNFHWKSPDAQGFQLVEFSFCRAAFCLEVLSLSCASSGIVLQVGSIIVNYFLSYYNLHLSKINQKSKLFSFHSTCINEIKKKGRIHNCCI